MTQIENYATEIAYSIFKKILERNWGWMSEKCDHRWDEKSEENLKRAITEYPGEICLPSEGTEVVLDIVPQKDFSKYHIRVPLFTVEEGRSDLHLEFTLWEISRPPFYDFEINNIFVP